MADVDPEVSGHAADVEKGRQVGGGGVPEPGCVAPGSGRARHTRTLPNDARESGDRRPVSAPSGRSASALTTSQGLRPTPAGSDRRPHAPAHFRRPGRRRGFLEEEPAQVHAPERPLQRRPDPVSTTRTSRYVGSTTRSRSSVSVGGAHPEFDRRQTRPFNDASSSPSNPGDRTHNCWSGQDPPSPSDRASVGARLGDTTPPARTSSAPARGCAAARVGWVISCASEGPLVGASSAVRPLDIPSLVGIYCPGEQAPDRCRRPRTQRRPR